MYCTTLARVAIHPGLLREQQVRSRPCVLMRGQRWRSSGARYQVSASFTLVAT
ncbi:MAG TPA: hypothetical protein VGF67_04760 [Ktedonobacteraceae bacterium]